MASKEPRKTAYLYDTPVENIFIGEYLPELPGDFVKVYLYALMTAGEATSSGPEAEEERIAKALHMNREDVARAFVCFEEYGLTERTAEGALFLTMKERLYGRGVSADTAEGALTAGEGAPQHTSGTSSPGYARLLDNRAVADMTAAIQNMVGRFLLPDEQESILGWISGLAIEPDLVTKAYEYSTGKGVDSHRYVGKVLAGWAEQGIRSRADAEEYLSEREERHFIYRRIMRALGNSRNVTEEERRLIDTWVDDFGCTMEEILDACAKTAAINNPNVKYVDAVLRNRRGAPEAGGKISRMRVMEYYGQLREQAEARAAMAREEVYERVPRIRALDEELREGTKSLTEALLSGRGDREGRLATIRRGIREREEEKARLLTEHSIPIDYMNVRYRCNRCKDTGLLDSGSLCECYMQVAEEAAAKAHEEKK